MKYGSILTTHIPCSILCNEVFVECDIPVEMFQSPVLVSLLWLFNLPTQILKLLCTHHKQWSPQPKQLGIIAITIMQARMQLSS